MINHNNRPSTGYRQQGGTMWTMLFNCGMILFVAYLGIKIFPAYNKHSVIQFALESSLDEFRDISAFNERKLINSMDKRLYVDGAEIPDLRERIVVTNSKDSIKVTIPYEKKIPLFSNMGVYLEFEASAEK